MQRFDYIARAKSELSKKQMYAGEAALISDNLKKQSINPPHTQALDLIIQAEHETDWDHSPYNCRIFFDEDAFNLRQQYAQDIWGYIKKTEHDSVLAIQIFDPNPKALLDFAKAMAKRRLAQPLAIIDLYGNIFYP